MQNTKYHLPDLPQDAAFEIRPSAGKGLGAFATSDIKATSRILREEPLFVIWKPDFAISRTDVETAFMSLTSVEKQQFVNMGSSENRSFISGFDTFMGNKFHVKKSGHAPNSDIDGQGMFIHAPRFNHSCVPNATVIPSSPGGSNHGLEIYAIKPIAKGEEIAINYDTRYYYLTTEIRRSVATWDFICDCRACNVNDPFHYVSDMRRALLRGLYYLLSGEDAPGCEGRPIPVTREADRGKTDAGNWHLVKPGSRDAEKVATWSMLSGYVSEAEGLADLASHHFKNAVIAIGKLSGKPMREAYWRDAYRWAIKSLDAIKSCRPADHGEVKDREKLLSHVQALRPSRSLH